MTITNINTIKRKKMGSGGDDPDNSDITKVPNYGLKVRLNHVYPEKRSQNYRPSIRVIIKIFPLIFRYIWYYIKSYFTGRSIVMDFVKVQTSKQCYGVPLGGIGCGTIGRGYRGEFVRFQLKPGIYEWNTVDANQFIVTIKDQHQETIFHSLLSTNKKTKLKAWTSSIDGSKCHYTGLYPRSWTNYDLSEYGIKLKCRQISPVIPHNYMDSSLPCGVFVWDVENVCSEERYVTIAFTFKNGTGTKSQDKASTCSSKAFKYTYNNCYSQGVMLNHTINKMPCTYILAAKSDESSDISKCLYFDPNSTGIEPWIQLKNNGCFNKLNDDSHGHVFGEMAVGIAIKLTVPVGESKKSEMTLVWDMPTVNFGKADKQYNKFYTKHFGPSPGLKIVSYAFNNYSEWEKKIYAWQAPVLNNTSLPDWYKSALFNETYIVSDGGSVWFDLNEDESRQLSDKDPRKTYGRFGYLEGHEYKMYNTYDVHFYASHTLHKNWPMLQKSLQYDLRDCVGLEIPTKMEMLYDGSMVERKVPNTCPHDIGDPGEAPYTLPNSYPIHDVSHWRDLNTKFVLQTYRDAVVTETGEVDLNLMSDMYLACYKAMHSLQQFDVDNDGLIENSGHPDQTFDVWTMTGASAYCGGLWLAALYVMTEMASKLGKDEDRDMFQTLLTKGKDSFHKKLWNGQYYNFDCSENEANSIMADQLCAQWYLRCCGVNDYPIFPKENVLQALKTIYKYNVQSFCNGNLGAVNGFLNGDVDTFAVQSEEVWTGVTYALSAHLIFEGFVEEGFKTAGGMYQSMRDSFGLAFDTPEALYAKKYYRSIGYMRPLSIWSMQIAIEHMLNQRKM